VLITKLQSGRGPGDRGEVDEQRDPNRCAGTEQGPRVRCLKPLLVALVAAVVAITALTGTAGAADGYYVTFVARACPSYRDIYANAAQSNSIESLGRLGTNNPDDKRRALVTPADQEIGRQLKCKPLRKWVFTLGRGQARRPAVGTWGSLSRVADSDKKLIVTRASTRLLDNGDNPVRGSAAIPGAVTIKLSSAEVSQTQRPSGLWVQGGVPNDPVLASTHASRVSPRYGFGALRCATDDVDGGNVQQLLFPAGIHHVFCYAYYVSRPSVGGTIIIRSQVVGAPADAEPSFPFSGDVSYAPSGFTLKRGQSVAFHRVSGLSWEITESAVPDYRLASIRCRSRTGESAETASAMALSVALAAGDTVRCTFVEDWVAPVGSLTIVQITEGGTGSFAYIAAPFHDDPTRVVATSSREGVGVNAQPERNLAQLITSGYVIQVLPPSHAVGRWRLIRADCGGRRREIRRFAFSQVTFRIVFRRDSVCTFTSRLTPPGSIHLSNVTEGATGPAKFVIESLGSKPRQFHQHVAASHQGAGAVAAPDTPTDATDHLDPGVYRITEQAPLDAPVGMTWKLTAATCNGDTVPPRQGSIVVTLTRKVPHLSCAFADTLQSDAGR
jgi:hypothetical protein